MRAIALITTLAFATPAFAQELVLPAPRQGWVLSAGAYGVLDANYDDERWYKGWPGFSIDLRVGQGLWDWLDVGLGLSFGNASGARRAAIFGGISVEGRVHFLDDFAARAGVGFGFVSVTDTLDPDAEALGGPGDYYIFGLSYDWFPLYDRGSGGFAISPVIQVRLLPRNQISAVTFWVGVELSWWLGLAQNRLELPVEAAFQE